MLMSIALVSIPYKRNTPLLAHLLQYSIVAAVIRYHYVMVPLALVQSKLQIYVSRRSVGAYDVAC